MNKIKRDFWNMSWNPVWGCKNKCVYCYARRLSLRYYRQIAKKEISYKYKYDLKNYSLRIADIPDHIIKEWMQLEKDLYNFTPTWLESNYVRKFPKKPTIIFVNSMSDPAYWKPEWYEKILKRITENIQHTFVILTKSPSIYKKYNFPHNTILGVTCTTQRMLNEFECDLSNWFEPNNKILISIEPIQEKIKIGLFIKRVISWIHVGEESGNRKGKIKATWEMIKPFYNLKDIPIFMKNNLLGLVNSHGYSIRKEFPIL